MVYVWALFGAACAVTGEWALKNYGFQWWVLPLELGIAWSIAQIFQTSNLLQGMALFTAGNVSLRILVSVLVLHEPLVRGNALLAGLMVAMIFARLWR